MDQRNSEVLSLAQITDMTIAAFRFKNVIQDYTVSVLAAEQNLQYVRIGLEVCSCILDQDSFFYFMCVSIPHALN